MAGLLLTCMRCSLRQSIEHSPIEDWGMDTLKNAMYAAATEISNGASMVHDLKQCFNVVQQQTVP